MLKKILTLLHLPTMIQIRPYQANDLPGIVQLWNEVFPNSRGHNAPMKVIEWKVEQDDSLFFVAIEDEKVLGSALGGYDGHRGWLYLLAVLPEYQRKGVGTQLVRQVEKALANLDCSKLNLQVRAENAAVVSFYQSLGYATEERISMGKKLS